MCATFVRFPALSCLSNGMSDKTHTQSLKRFPAVRFDQNHIGMAELCFPVEFGTSS